MYIYYVINKYYEYYVLNTFYACNIVCLLTSCVQTFFHHKAISKYTLFIKMIKGDYYPVTSPR